MKILIVHEIDYFDKVVFEFQIIPEILSHLGHEVVVVDYPEKKAPEGVQHSSNGKAEIFRNVHRVYNDAAVTVVRPRCFMFPAWTRFTYFLKVGSLLEKVIKSQRPDFILLYSAPSSGWQTIKAAKKYKVPVVFRSIDILHKLVPQKVLEKPTLFFEKYVYRRADFISALTPKMIKYATQMGAKSSAIDLDVAGVDTNVFKPMPWNFELAKEWGIKQGDQIAFFAGTLYDFSALDYVAENWDKVLKEVPRAKLLVLGEGQLFDKLKEIVRRKKMGKSIILTGWQKYQLVPDFVNLSNVCLNLFQLNEITREIMPSKLVQYLACKKPIVMLPLPGLMEMLKGEEDGVVYGQSNEEALQKLIELLKDSDQAEKIGENGYRLVKEKYEWQKIVEQMMGKIKDRFQIS